MSSIIRRVSFSKQNQPFIEFSDGEAVWQVNPFEQAVSLQFDMSQRFCIGGYDIETGENYACPHQATVDEKYEQCVACMKATGFNPAFYHATIISEQQRARNAEPHLVYLAYFAPGVVKVGISHAKRGIARLLEQGARAAVVLLECSSADIARSYEAKITGMYGIRDNVQLGKKAELTKDLFDVTQAQQTLVQIIKDLTSDLRVTFDSEEVQILDSYYFNSAPTPDLSRATDVTTRSVIAGEPIGLLGSILYCRYDDHILFLPLKKYVGYVANEASEPLDLGVQQMTLF
ncbi:MAG TPA: DUF2797 domain-containing protein [Candidatus Saccharibacteria bacterium]|nr:DUF2797 domain-containing protein [Candidatus Saccharibacteria bacterium]